MIVEKWRSGVAEVQKRERERERSRAVGAQFGTRHGFFCTLSDLERGEGETGPSSSQRDVTTLRTSMPFSAAGMKSLGRALSAFSDMGK